MESIFDQFPCFFGVGTISTLVDWGLFAVFNKLLGWPYWVSLIISFSSGAVVNFIANKRITFEDGSKRLAQPIVFFSIAIGMLCLSLYIMSVLVKFIDSLFARALVTGVIFIANFFLHKFITFGALGDKSVRSKKR